MNKVCTRIGTYTLAAFLSMTTLACQERTSGASGSRYSWHSEQQSNPALQSLINSKDLESMINGPQMTPAERGRLVDHVRRFYRGDNYQLIWIDGKSPSKRYRELTTLLDAADDHGLAVDLYKTPIEHANPTPEFDVRVTAAFFRYFMHRTVGRLDPRAFEPLWTLRPEKPELVAALTTAVKANNLAEAMDRLQPAGPQYRALQQALVRYRAIAAKGGWPAVTDLARIVEHLPKERLTRPGSGSGAKPNIGLKPGDQSPALAVVRRRLAIEGDLDPAHEKDSNPVFDSTLVDAVKRFQERHRIKPDGVINPETVKAMNVPVHERIRAIELNLERWRWLPDTMPGRYIMVNVPDFRLDAMENSRSVLDMRVVVGEPDNKTPIFADEMTEVIFSPYWNIPPNIARNETIPKASANPDYLARNNMEVLNASGEVVDPSSVDWSNPSGLRLRQRPGSDNALGGVKFVFPNTFDVYLHDTNATKLFDRIERGLSHGCVRVEQPHALAQYVLRDRPEWTLEAIQQAMQSGREQHVKVNTPIPVFIVYLTAWVHDGGVRFLNDIYGHDASQSAQLWPDSPELNVKQSTRR
jgi:murein L,D-transpeptidase YcbB/YkuD